MLKFAANVNGDTVQTITRNLDNLLVAEFNAGCLILQKAMTYCAYRQPAYRAVHNVALAALSRMQHDPARFSDTYQIPLE